MLKPIPVSNSLFDMVLPSVCGNSLKECGNALGKFLSAILENENLLHPKFPIHNKLNSGYLKMVQKSSFTLILMKSIYSHTSFWGNSCESNVFLIKKFSNK